MTRLLGVIVGSAIAVAALIVIVGVPQTDTAPLEPETPPQAPLPDLPETAAAAAVAEQTQDNDAVPTAIEAEPAPVQPAAVDLHHEVTDIEASAVVDDSKAVAATEQHWYAFWSPFRSQIAANGFVAQLQSVTGLDYRVVAVKPGVYEVAFAFVDDDDLNANLEEISAATGLDVPQT